MFTMISGALQALQILTPAPAAEFVLTGERGGDRLRLRASVDSASRLDWFLDDQYLGHSSPDAPLLLDLSAGAHKLVCLSPAGQISQAPFTVCAPEAGISFKDR